MKDFNVKFLNSSDDKFIPFLPFGVTTIEFTVEGKCKAGHIRPVNSTLKYPEKKEYVGFAEGNEDFLVVWGGGDERGQSIEANPTSRMFMQLIHLRGDHVGAIISLEHTAYGRKKRLEVRKPNGSPDFSELFKMSVEQSGPESKTARFVGTYLPMYYPRWFPPKQISYFKPQSLPEISLNYFEDDSGIEGPVEIFSEVAGQNRKIGSIKGDFRYSRIHVELFALFQSKSIFVLRVWFYWIHRRYKEGALGDEDILSVSDENSLGGYDSLTRLEIPDIERFDFVIDGEENRVIMYGTDIHYQEYWGRIQSPLVEAKIAGVADVFPVAAALYPLRFIQRAKYYNPIDSVKEAILKDMGERLSKKVSVGNKAQDESKSLGMGDVRAHVPYIGLLWNRGGKKFISSDSRKGARL